MPSRHRSRESALQILYQWDLRQPRAAREEKEAAPTSDPISDKPPYTVRDALDGFYGSLVVEDPNSTAEKDPFAEELVSGVVDGIEEIDRLIVQHSEHWRLERMPAVDRNILRLAVYEMTHKETPAAVAIHEALELALRFSTDESVAFVNGVLDAIRRTGANQ